MTIEAQADTAAEWIRSRWARCPRVGIVLGTGSGDIADSIQCESTFAYGDIPNFPRSTAIGHKGQLLCGHFAGRPVVAMQGRFHLYEGYQVDQSTIGIHVMNRLGVDTVLISNAAGGINPKFRLGEIMAIRSHIDFMFRTTPALCGSTIAAVSEISTAGEMQSSGTSAGERPGSVRPRQRSDRAYCPELIEAASQCARQGNFPFHQGVYVSMLGPNYETRAEYRWLRRIGGDTVGMSTVPEVTVASRYGMRVLACSIVTNVASPDALLPTTGEEVVAAAQRASKNLCQIFAAITKLADPLQA